jgi:vacuolar-type H+-ATPase subunit I/STV1
MFKPVPLVLVNIEVGEADISRTTAVLTKLRIIHLVNLVETPLGKLGYMGELERDLLARYERLSEEVDRWAQTLEITPQVVEIPPDLDPAKDIYRLEETVAQVRGQVGPLVQELQENEARLATLKRQQENLERLRPTGLDLEELSRLRFTYLTPGLVPTENLPKLEEALAHLHHALIPVTTAAPRTVILAAALASDREVVDQALKGAFFEPMDLPAAAPGSLEAVLAGLHSQIEALEKSQREAQARRDALREQLGLDLIRLRNRADLTRTLLRARVLFGKVDSGAPGGEAQRGPGPRNWGAGPGGSPDPGGHPRGPGRHPQDPHSLQ